jgi:hypothetical protein
MQAKEFIEKIIAEWQAHLDKGNKTLGTLPNDWTDELEKLIEEIANQKTERKINGIQRMIQDAENIKKGLNDGLTFIEIEQKYSKI